MAIIQTLRDDNNPNTRKKLRKLLKAEDVQNKDRMAVDPIIRLTSPEVLNTLRDVSNVMHQLYIVPEKYRFSETNKAGMFPYPIYCNNLLQTWKVAVFRSKSPKEHLVSCGSRFTQSYFA